MTVDRKDFIALDWVAGEIAETLKQSAAALDGYLQNREDVTRLRFCLTYIHQVHGTLKMVEFAGAALLAAEMEATAQALLAGRIHELQRDDALQVLRTALERLPVYLQQLQSQRRDTPAALLPLINDLRAVRGEALITESAVFSPKLTQPEPTAAAPAPLPAGELTEIAKKLRQMYQMALLNYLRNQDPRENLNYLAKVCARLAKLSAGRPPEALWKICIALFEGLLNRSITATAAVKLLLRQVDSQLKLLVDSGETALQQAPPQGLLKNLLYYIATSNANSRYISEIKRTYDLRPVPEGGAEAAADTGEELHTGTQALQKQLQELAAVLPRELADGQIADAVAAVKRAQDAAALLGMSRAQNVLQEVAQRLQAGRADGAALADVLGELAGNLETAAQPQAQRALFNDSEEAQEQLDRAFDAVMRESRNSLEQAKEAIIEFVATQWRHQCLEDVPELLASVRGSFAVAGMERASRVLAACEDYVRRELLGARKIPAWQLLDTLADAIASVDYYIERLSEDAAAECESILDVAEESVASLLSGDAAEPAAQAEQPPAAGARVIPFLRPAAEAEAEMELQEAPEEPLFEVPTLEPEPADEPAPEPVAELAAPPLLELEPEFQPEPEIEAAAPPVPEAAAVEPAMEEDEDAPDPEVVEIFIEEAGEVLEAINECLPTWAANPRDEESLSTIRRSFHTLKGSGRMVGAIDLGELAWSVENMLNRVIDGTVHIDPPRIELVAAATALVPAMVEAFQHHRRFDMAPAQALMDRAFALAKEQSPVLAPAAEPIPAAPEPAPAEPAAELPVEPEAAPAADDAEDADDSDNVLLDIFAGEAVTHIEVLEDYIRRAQELAGPAELSDDLQRALHTLKGSAHMANVVPMARVVTPVERLVKELRAAQLKADPEVMAVLEQSTALFRAGLDQLASDPQRLLPGTDEFVDWVEGLHHARLNHDDSEPAVQPDVYPQALNQFLGDAIELLSAVGDDIRAWGEERLSDDRRDTLAATVGQVLDSAEALGLAPVAELAQALQGLLARGADFGRPDDNFFSLAGRVADSLIDMLDRLAAGQELSTDTALLAAAEEFEFAAPQFTIDIPVLEDVVADPEPMIPEIELPEFSAGPAAADTLVWDVEAAAEPDEAAAEEETDDSWHVEAAPASATDAAEDFGFRLQFEPTDELPGDDLEAAPPGEPEAPAVGEPPAAGLAPEDEPSLMFEPLDAETGFEAAADDDDDADIAAAPDDSAGAFDTDILEGETIDLDAAFSGRLQSQGNEPEPVPLVEIDEEVTWESKPADTGVDRSYPQPPLAAQPPAAAAGGSDEEIDAEILEIFLEEAGDLLESIEEAVHLWSGDRENGIYLDDLQRLLHTLKGGARLAGLKNLGNLSHNFETMLINAQQQSLPVDDFFLGEVQAYQDQLVQLVEAVKVQGHGADHTAVSPLAAAEPEAETPAPAPPPAAGQPPVESKAVVPVEGKVVPFAPKKTAPAPLNAPMSREIEDLPEVQGLSPQLRRGPQEVVKISAQLLEELVNLAGETSIARSRAEEQVSEFVFSLDEMGITVERLQEQVRRLDLETEAQMLFRQEQVESEGLEGFDPLEFDRYSLLQQLSRSLLESASDLIDIRNTLADKSRDMETLLVQQSRINTELQEGLMRSRMVPFARMVPRLRRIVRQVAGELDKQVEFYVDNAEGELDRTVLEKIVAPLEHMLRNAMDHGIESAADRAAAGKPECGTIALGLGREGSEVVLTLSDDGRGIDLDAVREKAISRGLMVPGANLTDHEIMQFILQSGFSTARQVTQISGRGVGMDVVYSEIKQLGGALEIDSVWGQGTRFTVRLPFTVSVNRALMVSVAGDIFAVPLNTIEGIVRVSPFELEAYYQPDAPLFEYAAQPYLMRYMGALLRLGEKPNLEGQTMPLPVLLVRGSDHAVAVQVDGLLGSREIVVKTLGPQFGLVQGLSGATVLGDGSVVVILDLMAMIRADASQLHRDQLLGQDEAHADRSRPLLVMVVDDSVTVRKVTSRFLERQGMEVLLAKDGVDAIALLQETERVPDVMLLDIEMPRMDGFEVASRVRHTGRLQDMPIIMITSRTGEKHRERAFSLGVNKYLGKPYQEMVLLETIYELTGAAAPL